MPSLSPAIANPHGVTVQPLDFNHEHAPTVQTYHGLSIASDDKIIGRIVSWNPQPFQRAVNHVMELSHRTAGRPVDIVPGAASGYTVSATSNEMWDGEFERQLGDELYSDITDQVHPHKIDEYLFKGQSIYRWWEYTGCWFTDKNVEGYSADGDFMVRLTANMTYVTRNLRK